MARRFVIVEHDNDKHTFKAILQFMQSQEHIEVRSAEITDIEWLIRSAESNIEAPNGLKKSLIDVFKEIAKEKYDKIGIVWDLDTFTPEQRMSQINNAIRLAIQENPNTNLVVQCQNIRQIDEFVKLKVNQVEVEIACHFVNHEGKGELEDLLKAIKAKSSPIAIVLIRKCHRVWKKIRINL